MRVKRPNLIFLHGALGSKSYFLPLENLLQKEFRVFSLDFSGHGQSEVNYPFLIDGFKNQLLDFCADEKIEDAFVFGYSMGAYVALCAAFEKPDLFKSILSFGTKFKWNPEISDREIKHLNPTKIEEKVPKFATYLKELHPSKNWKDVLLNTQKLMLDLGEDNRIERLDLAKVNIPVFIGLGTEDKMVTKEESMEIVSRLSQGEFLSFKDFQHPFEKLDLPVLGAKIKALFLK